MQVEQRNPFREFEEMSDRLNRLFGRSNTSRDSGREVMTTTEWVPTVDISETDEEYLIKAEMPGVKKEDVKVLVQEGVLTLQGIRHAEKEEKGRKYHRIERSYGRFLRRFTLPDEVDEANLRAEYKEGVLHVALPKTEKAKPKAIKVKVA
ncbi:MAG TPA: Hsp20/alpha crystallin family protein [Nitrospirales bacterium]|nr:heat-shock protein Hsp20 [Nitrospiraceae bacterium]HNP29750.1 Hsp20/alpha crystallin family protein [Nitrospirales bacterium]